MITTQSDFAPAAGRFLATTFFGSGAGCGSGLATGAGIGAAFLSSNSSLVMPLVSVKEPMPKTTARLTLEGHAVKSLAGQALAGLMKPNLVSDLIQRGALR